MRAAFHWTLGATLVVVLAVSASADSGSNKRFVITDDCDPADAGWAPIGGCVADGEVTVAEFFEALPQGHPSWRIQPPYVEDVRIDEIRVRNTGGRDHTFTEVARFGNGFVPVVNAQGAFAAPECVTPSGAPNPDLVILEPGDRQTIEDLEPGTHNFQCCIHPWMRTVVKIDQRGRGRDAR